jgi:hypothetical protein
VSQLFATSMKSAEAARSSKKVASTSKVALDPSLLSPCGVYCGVCLAFKNGKCEGCRDMTAARTKKGKVFCNISVCAIEKNLAACSDCADYPCEKYKQEDQTIFSDGYMKYIREECRTSRCH